MSLADSTWQEFATARNVQETWVVWLYYDGGTNHIRLSDQSFVQLGVPVHGFVKSWGSIRRSIDLARSSAKVDNVSLELVNGTYAGAPLADELAPGSGSRNYVNRQVRIYSCLNGSAPGVRAYTGRLRGVSWSAGNLRLDIEPEQPWDFLSIPNVKAPSGRWFPVVYGDFAYNESTPSSPGYCAYRALWPAEVDEVTNEAAWCLMPQAYATNAVRPHFHEPTMDRYVPVVDSAGAYLAATTEHGDGYRAAVDPQLIHAITFKPTALSEATASTFTDPENAFDDADADESTTYAEATVTSGSKAIWMQASNGKLDVYDTVAGAVQFKIVTPLWFSRHGAPDPTLWLSVDGGTSFIGQYQPTAAGDVTVTWTIDETELPGGVLPQQIGFYLFVNGGTTSVTCRIKDVRVTAISRTARVEAGMTDSEAGRALNRAKEQLQHEEAFYFGADGLTRSWTTGAVTEIHELHRDLLYRFAGYTTAPDGWSDLSTARSGWSCRWWTRPGDDPLPLADVLAMAQLEGCFIFTWSATGVGRYLFVQDSYSSGDVAATLVEGVDCGTIDWGHVEFSELVTSQEVSYDPDPAEDGRYREEEALVNTTSRTAWNIQTKENVVQRELDMLVASVDDHCAYYDTVFGDLRRTGGCQVRAHRHRVLEIGDVIQIDGDARYYMITDERRSPGGLSIKFREVG